MPSKPSRILFCLPTAYVGGGVEEWLWALVPELTRAGWDCRVGLVKGGTFHDPQRFLAHYPYAQSLLIDGTSGYLEQRRTSLFKLFDQTQPDIIVVSNLADALYAAVDWKNQRKADVRIVSCLHGMNESIIHDILRCADNLDLVAGVSKRVIQLVESRCAERPPQTAHLPAGVPAPAQLASWAHEPFHVGYVGRLDEKEKRIGDLVRLIQTLSEEPFQFHIAGDGPEARDVQARLKSAVDAGRVVFYGQVPREKLYAERYPKLQALVLFSPAEGGPIVAWEAMRHGVVPVVSDFEGRVVEGVIRPGENALVFDVGDVEAAAQCLRQLAEDRVLHQALSGAAQHIDEKYTLEQFGAGWDAALRDLLAAPVRRQPLAPVLPSHPVRSVLRRALGKTVTHAEPGGEWPHGYNGCPPGCVASSEEGQA